MAEEDLDQQLLDLQEDFRVLQEQATEVEQRQERQIQDLEAALNKLQHQNDILILEKLEVQLSEKDDEIRYLQVELEAALTDQRRGIESTNLARQSSHASIIAIHQSLENINRLTERT